MLEEWDELREYGPDDVLPQVQCCPVCKLSSEVVWHKTDLENLDGKSVMVEWYYCKRCKDYFGIQRYEACSQCYHPAHEGQVCQCVADPDGDICCCDYTEQSSAMPAHDGEEA